MTVKNESQFSVLLGGPYNQADFTEFSGGSITRDIERYPRGLVDEMGVTPGIKQYEDITLRAPYDPEVHDAMIEKFTNYCGEAIDVVVTPMKVCPEKKPDGRSRIYTGCVPNSCSPPGVNRGPGSKTAMFELKFAVQGFKLG